MLERRREPRLSWDCSLRKPSNAPSQITIFCKPPGGSLAKAWVSAETAALKVGTWRETKPGYPPPPPPPPHFGGREKGRGFSPSLPSATIQHAPQGRRITGWAGPPKLSPFLSRSSGFLRLRTYKWVLWFPLRTPKLQALRVRGISSKGAWGCFYKPCTIQNDYRPELRPL